MHYKHLVIFFLFSFDYIICCPKLLAFLISPPLPPVPPVRNLKPIFTKKHSFFLICFQPLVCIKNEKSVMAIKIFSPSLCSLCLDFDFILSKVVYASGEDLIVSFTANIDADLCHAHLVCRQAPAPRNQLRIFTHNKAHIHQFQVILKLSLHP